MRKKKQAKGPLEFEAPEAALKRMKTLLPSIQAAANDEQIDVLYSLFVMAVNPAYKQYGRAGVFRFVEEKAAEEPPVKVMKKEEEEEYFEVLTPRERDVLAYIIHGKGNKEIAEELGVTLHTINTHVTNILAKTGKKSRGQVIAAFYTSAALKKII